MLLIINPRRDRGRFRQGDESDLVQKEEIRLA